MVWLDYVITLPGELLPFVKEKSLFSMSTTTLKIKILKQTPQVHQKTTLNYETARETAN